VIRFASLIVLATGALLSLQSTATAAVLEFTVDPAQSVLSISSQTSVLGAPLDTTPQAPGSLGTSYSGSIFADLTPRTIQLLAGSSLVAGSSGDWLPGTDYSNYPADLDDPSGYISTPVAANYGIITDLTPLGAVLGKQGFSPSAIRGLAISLVDAGPKTLAGNFFDESDTATDFTAGAVFYSSGGAPPITDLANTVFPGPTVDAPGSGSLVIVGNEYVLTIPVSFQVSYPVNFLTVTTEYRGTIVATAPVPEPSTLMLLALAAGSLAVWRKRK
jgi:hypothetical protein